MKYFVLFVLSIFVSINSYANDKILVFNQNSSNFPTIKFSSYNIINNINQPFIKDDLEIFENSIKINDFNVVKQIDTISEKNLFVFALDLSGSINLQKLQLYQSFISNFLDKIDLNKNI